MIIECEQLFDGETVQRDVRLVIDAGRVQAIEPLAQPTAFAHDDVISAPFAMPGLIDSQARVFGYHEGPPEGRPFEPHTCFLRLMAYAGVTTIRDVGNTLETLQFSRRWASEQHGLHIYGSGPLLDDVPLTWAFTRIVDTPSEAERAVRLLLDAGVDFIAAYRHMQPNVLRATVEASHAMQHTVQAHPGATSALAAAQAGIDALAGLADFLEPAWVATVAAAQSAVERVQAWAEAELDHDYAAALLDSLVSNCVYVCPTLLATRRRAIFDEAINEQNIDYMVAIMPYHRHFKSMRNPIGYMIGKRQLSNYMPVADLDKPGQQAVDRGLERMRSWLLKLHEAGVPLVVGSDTPTQSVVPGHSMVQEMQQWVLSGIPPLAVLKAATSTAADLLGVADVGRLRPGAWADVLVLNADPLQKITAIGTPEKQVYCRGQLVDRAAIRAQLTAQIEQQA